MIRPTVLFSFLFTITSIGADHKPELTFTTHAPRDEISPKFDRKDNTLILTSPDQEGTNGFWQTKLPVVGGQTYQLSVKRKADGISHPRRSCAVRIEWEGVKGNRVTTSEKVNPYYFGKNEPRKPNAAPEFPTDQEEESDGEMNVAGFFTAPKDATTAVIQFHLRWAPGGKVEWSDFSFQKAEKPPARKVVLAAIHYNLPGNGRTVEENRRLFVPLIEKAAAKNADFIVLPELMTCKGVTHDYASVGESVPGPTTKFFGALAKKHDCYIVVGLPERVDHLVYNVAVLLGPDGKVAGKYRKVTLPREEIQRGISPGHEYPVFNTRFGKVGMMICYDVFFPEVARELAMNGAEIIALPIWGGNPRLAAARCAENGIYLVSSTYTDHNQNWMKSAIWDREGDRIVEATEWGTVVTKEIDLNERTYWNGLGDFRSRIRREAPVRKEEKDFKK